MIDYVERSYPEPQLARALAEDSANVVFEHVLHNGDARHTLLSNLAVTRFLLGKTDAAHALIQDFSDDTEDMFMGYCDLLKAGDESALAPARRLAALDTGALTSAENAVSLVDAGDMENTDIARQLTSMANVKFQPDLYSALYRAGDIRSGQLGAEAAVRMKQYVDEYESGNFHDRWIAAVGSIMTHAIEIDDRPTARFLLDTCPDEGLKQRFASKLFASGEAEAFAEIYEGDVGRQLDKVVVRNLAVGGLAFASRRLRMYVRQAEGTRLLVQRRPAPTRDYPTSYYLDLAALHQAGEGWAAGRATDTLGRDIQPTSYDLYALDSADIDTAGVVQTLYERDPTYNRRDDLLRRSFHVGLWHEQVTEAVRTDKSTHFTLLGNLTRVLARVGRGADNGLPTGADS